MTLADVLAEGKANPGQDLVYEGERMQELVTGISQTANIFGPPETEEYRRKQAEWIAKLRTASRIVLKPKSSSGPGNLGRACGFDWHAEYAA